MEVQEKRSQLQNFNITKTEKFAGSLAEESLEMELLEMRSGSTFRAKFSLTGPS